MSQAESRRSQMFSVLTPAQIAVAQCFAAGSPQHFEPGAILCGVGERNSATFIILDGSDEISRGESIAIASSVYEVAIVDARALSSEAGASLTFA